MRWYFNFFFVLHQHQVFLLLNISTIFAFIQQRERRIFKKGNLFLNSIYKLCLSVGWTRGDFSHFFFISIFISFYQLLHYFIFKILLIFHVVFSCKNIFRLNFNLHHLFTFFTSIPFFCVVTHMTK